MQWALIYEHPFFKAKFFFFYSIQFSMSSLCNSYCIVQKRFQIAFVDGKIEEKPPSCFNFTDMDTYKRYILYSYSGQNPKKLDFLQLHMHVYND
jgi:hypothetical protein